MLLRDATKLLQLAMGGIYGVAIALEVSTNTSKLKVGIQKADSKVFS